MSGFLKWPGGKSNLLEHIIPKLEGKRLIEPFVGAGNVFLSTDFDEYILADTNLNLINMYKSIAKEPEQFKEEVKLLIDNCNSEKKYYELRDKFNDSTNVFEKSTLFLYLNRIGYRGLVRYNNKGIYNVPYGHYKSVYTPMAEINHFISIKDRCTFLHQDFKETFKLAEEGDVVYCDPPYSPIKPNSFTKYTEKSFTDNDHIKLNKLAMESVADVVISNHDTPRTRELYANAELTEITLKRRIKHLEVKELLVKYKK